MENRCQTQHFPSCCGNSGIPAVPHGFRSSFRDWAAERTDATRGLSDMLKPFKVYPGTIRPDVGDPARGYKREELERVWESYFPLRGGILPEHNVTNE